MIYFSIQQGMLVKEFEGSAEDYKAKFEKDKAQVIEDVEKAIKENEQVEHKLPDDFDSMSEEDKKVVELSLAQKKAETERTISRLKQKLDYATNLKVSDIQLFGLEPITIE